MEFYTFSVGGEVVGTVTDGSGVITIAGLKDGDVVSVVVTNNNCDSESKSTAALKLLPEFLPTLTTEYTNVCPGTDITLTVNSGSDEHQITAIQILSEANINIGSDISINGREATVSVSLQDAGAATISALVTTTNGCTATTAEVEVVASGIVVDNVTTENACEGQAISFTAEASGALNDNIEYQFTVIDSEGYKTVIQEFSSENSCSYTLSNAGTYTLKVEAKDTDVEGTDCVAEMEKTFVVNPLPTLFDSYVTLVDDISAACADGSVAFEVTIGDGQSLIVYMNDEEVAEFASDGSAISNSLTDTQLSCQISGSTATVTFSLDYTYGNVAVGFQLRDETTGCLSRKVTSSDKITFYPGVIVMADGSPVATTSTWNGTLTMCEGTTMTLTMELMDTGSSCTINNNGSLVSASAFQQTVSAGNVGEEKQVEIMCIFGNGTLCTYTLTVTTLDAPAPAIELADASGNALAKDVDGVEYICAGEPFTITASGASKYTLSVTRDDVDFSSNSETYDSVQDYVLDFNGISYSRSTANGLNYSTIVFSYDFAIGTCSEALTKTLRVYKSPDATLTTSPSAPTTVIAGAKIELSLTDTDNDLAKVTYVLYNSSTKEQVGDAVEADPYETTIFYLPDAEGSYYFTATIESEHGCSYTLTSRAFEVLEGLNSYDLEISSDYYCEDSDGNGDGVTVTLSNSQSGVVYTLNTSDGSEVGTLTWTGS